MPRWILLAVLIGCASDVAAGKDYRPPAGFPQYSCETPLKWAYAYHGNVTVPEGDSLYRVLLGNGPPKIRHVGIGSFLWEPMSPMPMPMPESMLSCFRAAAPRIESGAAK